MTTPRPGPEWPGRDARPGVYRLGSDAMASLFLASYEAEGWTTAVVDLADVEGKPAVLEAFAVGLDFPAWVGRNWDALDDALRDLAWWPPGRRGRLILVKGIDRSTASTARDRDVVRDVLERAATSWRDNDAPLLVLLAP